MKKIVGLVILLCGLVVSPYFSLAKNMQGDHSGSIRRVGENGNTDTNDYRSWGIKNNSPFSGLQADMDKTFSFGFSFSAYIGDAESVSSMFHLGKIGGTNGKLQASADSSDIQLVGSWPFGEARAVAINQADNIVYLGSGRGIYILDIKNPSSPQELSSISTPGLVKDIFYVNGKVFVADGSEGLRIINVSNPTNPFNMGYCSTQDGDARGVYVVGSYAYVAARGTGLHIIDISNPNNPNQVGFSDSTFSPEAVYVVGTYAYIADYAGWSEKGLHVIDVSDPTKPYRAGSYYLGCHARSVFISGPFAYVADGPGGLHIIDIRYPNNLQEVGFWDDNGGWIEIEDVYVDGSFAYVVDATSDGGLRVLNVENPKNPYEVSSFQVEVASAERVVLSGSFAYVAYGSAGLQIIDVSEPATPFVTGTFGTPGRVGKISVLGPYAYLSSQRGFDDLRIIDVSNPTKPHQIGIYEFGKNAAVHVLGSFAYCLYGAGLHVINVQNPKNPYEVGFCDLGAISNTPQDVFVSGSLAYATFAYGYTSTSGLYVVNVEDPTNPYKVSFCNECGRGKIIVSGSFAYVLGGVISVEDPKHPYRVGSYPILSSGFDSDFFVSGSFVYIGNSIHGLRIIDVGIPQLPVEAGFYIPPGESIINGVSVSGSYAYIGDWWSDLLRVIDVSNPRNPYEVASHRAISPSGPVNVSGPYVYVPNGSSGFDIFRSFFGQPIVDIRANGSDGPIVVSPNTPVSIQISLNPGSTADQNADWWVAAHTSFNPPFDWYAYVSETGWLSGINIFDQTPLFNVPASEVLNMRLPLGYYTFYFGIDAPDGSPRGPWWGLDAVDVTVQ